MFSLSLDINWWGLIVPLAYVLVLGGSLMTFSTIYRKRKAAESANLEPWFGPHLQRNIYLSLLHLEPEVGLEKSPKVPDSVIRAALIRRAVEDIHRIIQVRSAKAACSSLLQNGSVGDELWQRFNRVEKEMEEELRDVVQEANALAPNWGQTIFQSAHEIAANTVLRKRLNEVQAQADSEKQWWETRKAAIQKEFMDELNEDEEKKKKGTSSKAPSTAPFTVGDDETVIVEQKTLSATTAASKKKKGKE